MKFLILSFSCLFLSSSAIAQNKIAFFKIIKDDSVALFFNRDFLFTEKNCAQYERLTRVDNSGDFNGYFQDINIKNELLGTGEYLHGQKHGYFEVFHPNGKIYCKGYYENDKPIGIWKVFYDTGSLEKTLNVTDSGVFLVQYIDPQYKIRVQNGSGKYIDWNVSGRIVNGKPDGKWIARYGPGSEPLYIEIYDNGVFLKSKGPFNRPIQSSNKIPKLTNFFPENYLSVLEKFGMKLCSDSSYNISLSSFLNNWEFFNPMIKALINEKVNEDLKKGNKNNYTLGQSHLSIHFLVDDKGIPYNFTVDSGSDAYLTEILFETLKNAFLQKTFQRRNKPNSFNLDFLYSGGYFYYGGHTFDFKCSFKNN